MAFFGIAGLTCGQSACIIFGNCLAAKLFMTTFVRIPAMMKLVPMPADLSAHSTTEVAKKLDLATYQNNVFQFFHRAQLNDAEYAGPLIAALLFLELKGVAAPVGATLVAFGAVAYFWGQVLTRNRLAQPLGGGPRYVGMGCLTYALYGTVF